MNAPPHSDPYRSSTAGERIAALCDMDKSLAARLGLRRAIPKTAELYADRMVLDGVEGPRTLSLAELSRAFVVDEGTAIVVVDMIGKEFRLAIPSRNEGERFCEMVRAAHRDFKTHPPLEHAELPMEPARPVVAPPLPTGRIRGGRPNYGMWAIVIAIYLSVAIPFGLSEDAKNSPAFVGILVALGVTVFLPMLLSLLMWFLRR